MVIREKCTIPYLKDILKENPMKVFVTLIHNISGFFIKFVLTVES